MSGLKFEYMEEKKLDVNSIIGFVLIFGILAYMLWQNKPTPEELEAQEKAKQEQIAAENSAKQDDTKVITADDFKAAGVSDSLQLIGLKINLVLLLTQHQRLQIKKPLLKVMFSL